MARIQMRHKDVVKRNDPIVVIQSTKAGAAHRRTKVYKIVLAISIILNIVEVYLLLKP